MDDETISLRNEEVKNAFPSGRSRGRKAQRVQQVTVSMQYMNRSCNFIIMMRKYLQTNFFTKQQLVNERGGHRAEVAACLRGRGTHFVSGPCGGDDDCGGGSGGDFVTVEGKATQSGLVGRSVFTDPIVPKLDFLGNL